MSIVLRHSETLELNIIDYMGAISPHQLKAVAAYGAHHPPFLQVDCLNVVQPDADFSSVDLCVLDALFERYRRLYASLEFQIYRRSAWLCFNPAAERHVEYWTSTRDLRQVISSTVRRFDTLAEAADWLVLGPAELQLLERRESFREITRFDDPPLRAAIAR